MSLHTECCAFDLAQFQNKPLLWPYFQDWLIKCLKYDGNRPEIRSHLLDNFLKIRIWLLISQDLFWPKCKDHRVQRKKRHSKVINWLQRLIWIQIFKIPFLWYFGDYTEPLLHYYFITIKYLKGSKYRDTLSEKVAILILIIT